MPLFAREDQKILFVHIPKTGGTTLENFFRDQDMFRQDAEHLYTPWSVFVKKSLREGCRGSLQHLTVKEMRSIFPDKLLTSITDVFTVTRDPYDRLLSEYWYLKKKVFLKPQDYDIWGVDPSMIQNALGDFDVFVDLMHREYLRDPSFLDNHFRPQVDFLKDLPEHLVSRLNVLEFEDLGKGMLVPDLVETYSLTKDVVVAGHKNQHTPTDHTMSWYRETEDKIREWYKEDFDILGYPYRPYNLI
jgi:hypothetical protein